MEHVCVCVCVCGRGGGGGGGGGGGVWAGISLVALYMHSSMLPSMVSFNF